MTYPTFKHRLVVKPSHTVLTQSETHRWRPWRCPQSRFLRGPRRSPRSDTHPRPLWSPDGSEGCCSAAPETCLHVEEEERKRKRKERERERERERSEIRKLGNHTEEIAISSLQEFGCQSSLGHIYLIKSTLIKMHAITVANSLHCGQEWWGLYLTPPKQRYVYPCIVITVKWLNWKKKETLLLLSEFHHHPGAEDLNFN